MKAQELINKLNKLQGIYNQIYAEIDAYDTDVSTVIVRNWIKRKRKIQLNLIDRFKKDVELQTLKDVQMLFKIQSDLSTKTNGYIRLHDQIIKLTKQK